MKNPVHRKLRGYAFDPSLSIALDTVQVNNIIYKVDWEDLTKLNENQTIPTGEYLEIIDFDPASQTFYEPVDLNDRNLLAQDGLEPSVSSPQFHQQMVYAVIMTTIKNFEAALGRKVIWAERVFFNEKNEIDSHFVRRLRIYPHALRQANAYYTPIKKSILFGYFPANPANPSLLIPGGTVFTCLSHDIIAHETTHAMLDGLRKRYIEDTHPDTRAFHEAFADIVALFQHFTFPDVLKHQISKTRGNLADQNLLGQLAEEFGKARGGQGSLRDAIGYTDPDTKLWVPYKPDPKDYATKMEFHERGSILVAAVFDAFLNIYKQNIRKLLRVATNGSGLLPDGDLHPDLVDLIAEYTSKVASRILKICVRAIDYCPPIDVTFGDFLRAIITSDKDIVPYDKENYRVAFIEAFQKRGIFPTNVKSMSEEELAYDLNPELLFNDGDQAIFNDFLRDYKNKVGFETDRENIYNISKDFIRGSKNIVGLHKRIHVKFFQGPSGKKFEELTGLKFYTSKEESNKNGFDFSTDSSTYTIESLSLASRTTPEDKIVNNVIITMVQKRGLIAKKNQENTFDKYFVPKDYDSDDKQQFIFKGGCTLIFDLDTSRLKYAIKKDINDKLRMEQQFRYMNGEFNTESESSFTYFDEETLTALSGPFAFMHSHISN